MHNRSLLVGGNQRIYIGRLVWGWWLNADNLVWRLLRDIDMTGWIHCLDRIPASSNGLILINCRVVLREMNFLVSFEVIFIIGCTGIAIASLLPATCL